MGFVKWHDVKDQIPTSQEGRAQARSALEAEFAGYLLREMRKEQGLSQADLAQRMGVSQRRVSAIERGDLARVEVETVSSFVSALGGVVHLVAEINGETVRITGVGESQSPGDHSPLVGSTSRRRRTS